MLQVATYPCFRLQHIHASGCNIVVLASADVFWWMRFVLASWWEGLFFPACPWVEPFLSLWWAGLCQGICLAGKTLFRKTLSSLSADGWGCVSVLLVVWPEASEPTCCLEPSLGEKMAVSTRAHASEYSPESLPLVSLFPQ